MGAPRVKSVRGLSDFGSSFVYVIFDDDVDLYWARSRTLEYLSSVLPKLPEGVHTELGPDATALGWVFQYVLEDRSGTHNLAELRSYQDWYLNDYLKAVPGVAEVATVGGFVRQYQVSVDPNRLRAYGITIQQVVDAVKAGNRDVGGEVVEAGGAELMVRGFGYARSEGDLEQVLVAMRDQDTPIRVKDLGRVTVGSDFRRGASDLDGAGEAVSGIVVMRQGQNALEVIDRVKARLKRIEPSLPTGMRIVPVYDRSELIRRSIGDLKGTILEVVAAVAIVVLLFLRHLPSALIPLLTIPFSVLIAFVPVALLGVNANVMSLGGIAIAVGALVDASVIVAEQTHKKLEEWDRSGRRDDPRAVIVRAVKQVGRPSFYALLVIAVSFLPVLTLQAEEGRLFKPLAYTKSLSMAVAAMLAITLDPALRLLLTRVVRWHIRPVWLNQVLNAALVGKIHREEDHPITRRIMRVYEPVAGWGLRHKPAVFGIAALLVVATIPVWQKLGTEFMPPLDEGTLLYMPTTMPGISITEARRLLEMTDRRLKAFPEVEHVLGKAGRASTSTDPAPLSMLETVITLKPVDAWPRVPTWYSSWAPRWAKPALRHITPDHISKDDLVARMDGALKLPGVSNAWSMPIRGRIDMLTTGVRTPLGMKIAGDNVDEVERIGTAIEKILPSVPGTRGVFSERVGEGHFLDFRWNRVALAHFGLTIDQAQSAVQYAIGGEDVTTMIDGRERYPVNIRYLRDFRSDLESLNRMLVPLPDGTGQVPIADLCEISTTAGPAMLRNEDGMLTGYVYVDISGTDYLGYVERAARVIQDRVVLPPGASVSWTGQYEAITRNQGPPAPDSPAHARHHLPPVVSQHAVVSQDAHRAARRSVFGGWRGLGPVSARVSPQRRRLGGPDCAHGRRCRNRRVHAPVPGRRLRTGEAREPFEQPRGFDASRARRRVGQSPAEADDGHGDGGRPAADHVGDRHRRGSDETDRSAHDRRAADVVRARAGRVPGRLSPLEVIAAIRGPDGPPACCGGGFLICCEGELCSDELLAF